MICDTCFYHCAIEEGGVGQCRARGNRSGTIVSLGYGKLTSLALDPIEKKPLARFFSGSMILSAGSFGCNLHCPFCQNAGISQTGAVRGAKIETQIEIETKYVAPETLAREAERLKPRGNIGVAFTYNEPLISWEYVRDAAKLVRDLGMKNVIVTNGSVTRNVLEETLPYTDAMNIDLKGFSDAWYKKLGGDLETVKEAIALCAPRTHVELTTLIVPSFNDSEDEMRRLATWVSAIDKRIPLHITRFFPRWHMADLPPTPIKTLYNLAEVARDYLDDVLCGNC